MTGPFRFYLRVRYGECDAQKVVFNSRYGEYVDVGVNEFLRASGVLDQFTARREVARVETHLIFSTWTGGPVLPI